MSLHVLVAPIPILSTYNTLFQSLSSCQVLYLGFFLSRIDKHSCENNILVNGQYLTSGYLSTQGIPKPAGEGGGGVTQQPGKPTCKITSNYVEIPGVVDGTVCL